MYLVACAKKKRASARRARDLYSSALFTKASELADRCAEDWFILSAKHGLLHPERVIEPYDLTLNSMSAAERRAWADGVLEMLLPSMRGSEEMAILAGSVYRENLVGPIKALGCQVEIPMDGLKIGRQLQWLNEKLGESG